jgi:hypothetical protein
MLKRSTQAVKASLKTQGIAHYYIITFQVLAKSRMKKISFTPNKRNFAQNQESKQ